MNRHKLRGTENQSDRAMDRQTERETDAQTHAHAPRHRDRQAQKAARTTARERQRQCDSDAIGFARSQQIQYTSRFVRVILAQGPC